MRTALIFLIVCALLPGCPKPKTSAAAASTPATAAGTAHSVVLLLSGSTQSQWDAELLGALSAQLGIDPFSKEQQAGHLDVLGPYDIKVGDTPATLSICLLGLDSFAGMQAQSDLGVEARDWALKQKPEVAWLDGDRAQFFVGRDLVVSVPIVFTGVVSDRQTYYGTNASGIYKRPALTSLLKLIWDRSPKAKRFALLSDSAPDSRGTVSKFNELLSLAVGQQGKVVALPPAQDWSEMRQRLLEAQQKADAAIVAGVGEEQGGEAFKPPCPDGLLKGITIPVVAVGGSDAATCFPVVVRLRASAHVKLALGMMGQVLDGTNASGIPTVTPEDMQVTVNEQ